MVAVESPLNPTSTLCELAKAYADGIATAAGAPWTLPDPNNESQVIRGSVALHKPNLRGEKLFAWVRHSAETYRRVMDADWKFQRGFRPSKWVEWLNAGGDKAPTRRVIGAPPVQPAGAVSSWKVPEGVE